MRTLVILLLAVGLAACAELGDELLYEAAAGAGGAGEPTFESVDAIFQSSCAFAGCHSSESRAQNLSLDEGDAFESLLGPAGTGGVPTSHRDCAGLTMVEPGAPDESCLWVLVDEGVMPPGGLPQPQRDTIRAWIEAGAPPPAN